MLDINKTLSNIHNDTDPEGYLFDLKHWSPQVANQLADRESLELTDEHWEIIFHLREHFRVHGNAESARVVLHELEEKFSPVMGRGHLYQLFPEGPVSQGSRIAGLPERPHSHDLSFGTVM